MRAYSRDKRSPIASSELASKVMSSIKAKDTKPELLFRRHLWKAGLRGYRLHPAIPGRPDIAFPSKKIAIFIHGCYWHRCPKCNLSVPKSNSTFWKEKFTRNVERDRRKEADLIKLGWVVLVFWECEVKSMADILAKNVKNTINGVEKINS
jgi:DNA mismatch endonuclease, patch repair protein